MCDFRGVRVGLTSGHGLRGQSGLLLYHRRVKVCLKCPPLARSKFATMRQRVICTDESRFNQKKRRMSHLHRVVYCARSLGWTRIKVLQVHGLQLIRANPNEHANLFDRVSTPQRPCSQSDMTRHCFMLSQSCCIRRRNCVHNQDRRD